MRYLWLAFGFSLLLAALGSHAIGAAPEQPTCAARGSCCALRSKVTPLGAGGIFRIDTPHGTGFARWPTAPRSTTTRPGTVSPLGTTAAGYFTVDAHDSVFDADGDTATFIDTLRVPVNGHVRWILKSSMHTITNGRNSADPAAATEFSILIDATHPTFDTTFTAPDTVDYFCFFHEPLMAGVVIVDPAFGVVGVPEASAGPFRFLGVPSPNPSRGVVRFDVESDRGGDIEASVFDLQGRRVATIYEGFASPGHHEWVWDRRTAAGLRAVAGVYLVRIRGFGVTRARSVILLP